MFSARTVRGDSFCARWAARVHRNSRSSMKQGTPKLPEATAQAVKALTLAGHPVADRPVVARSTPAVRARTTQVLEDCTAQRAVDVRMARGVLCLPGHSQAPGVGTQPAWAAVRF